VSLNLETTVSGELGVTVYILKIAQRADSTRTAWNIGIPCHWVADYASGIAKVCTNTLGHRLSETYGQLFDITGYWNVIVASPHFSDDILGGRC